MLTSGRRSGSSKRLPGWTHAAAALLAAGVTAWGLGSGTPAESRGRTPDGTGTAALIALADLPAEGRQTHRLILAGGPFPYDKDGSVFGNRERLLPARPRGHYREYTVRTPGSRDRGARRLVCGGEPPTAPEACFYTDDHYASFRLVAP